MEEHETYEKLMRAHNGGPIPIFDQIRCPRINKAWIEERMVLPQQFLGACTLKEGTFVIILWLQCVAVVFTAYLCVYIYHPEWRDYGKTYWEMKFLDDFDPYYERKPDILARVKYLYPLWDDIVFAMIIAHAVYFVTGLGVCYGLCHNHCHPIVYVPWILVSGFLVACCYFACLVMFWWTCFYMRRLVSVTWDVVPMVCVGLYAYAWSYGYLIVIAHYKTKERHPKKMLSYLFTTESHQYC